jgi:hypothetical protein
MAELKPFPSLMAVCAVFIGVGVFLQERITPGSTPGTTPCLIDGQLTPMPDLPEASGIAVSRQVPGRLWTHNDSGQATLFALDGQGTVTARVGVTGAAVDDWEAIAAGPCPDGSCLFVADIGDNGAKRQSVTLYRIAEPAANEASVAVADVIEMTYPDGAHDAEALFVTQDGTVVIVTKGETGPVNVYRVPANAPPGAAVTLERIGASIQGQAARDQRITDGAASPDGQWVALRSRTSLVFYRTADFLKGQWREVSRVDLAALREPQGEGVALGDNGAVYLASEGGGDGQAGTFTRFTCELQP